MTSVQETVPQHVQRSGDSEMSTDVAEPSRDEMVSKVRDIIKDAKICYLTTEGEDRSLHTRPMYSCQQAEFNSNGELWFFTYGDSMKVKEIESNNHVTLSFTADTTHQYLTISGFAELSTDKNKMTALWEEGFQRWFPRGLDEPDIALLKVTAKKLENWDPQVSKAATLHLDL
eukprot:GILJ01010832.1.p1 GENE.GILJ01010832.1~~GILJ01010832.1.p1  ORF type:complete len:173 (-),score=18.44 GILJ01010832.1:109-627(-)